MSEYSSEYEKRYFEEILPKLDQEILKMDLGRRTNCCLVNAKIYTIEKLVEVIKKDIHIDMIISDSREEIKEKLKGMGMIDESI